MPSSAGASAENDILRWDPGRRPSSRVSSTSGALGSRLRKRSLPWWCKQNLRESTGRCGRATNTRRPRGPSVRRLVGAARARRGAR